jgi:hypothetical protein
MKNGLIWTGGKRLLNWTSASKPTVTNKGASESPLEMEADPELGGQFKSLDEMETALPWKHGWGLGDYKYTHSPRTGKS